MASAVAPRKRKTSPRPKTLVYTKTGCTLWTAAIVKAGGTPIRGFVTDVDKMEMGLFATEELRRGTMVLLDVEGNLTGKLQAKIVSCRSIKGNEHIIKDTKSKGLWRLRIRAIIGGQDEANFPEELVNALLRGNGA